MQIDYPGAEAAASSGQPTRLSAGKSRYAGLPIVPSEASTAALRGGRFALFFTGLAWVAYVIQQAIRLIEDGGSSGHVIESLVYLGLVTLLAASCSAYLLARIGYFDRVRAHRRVARSVIDDYFAEHNPSLTVLVPSYREDPNVVRKTLLSAALRNTPTFASYY